VVLKIVLGGLAVLVLGVVAAVLVGAAVWRRGTGRLRGRLEASKVGPSLGLFTSEEIADLPPPVQRYFRAVLSEGQRPVRAVKLIHEGTFNLGTSDERWLPFVSNQVVVTSPPGFDWDAKVRMGPGASVFVHDAYLDGEGILLAKLLGLVSVADLRGTPEMAQGELLRFLAEAPWYPTSLLPSQGVTWEAVGDRSARATLKDKGTRVSMTFTFDERGLIETGRTEGRFRAVGDAMVPTPWRIRLGAYQEEDGMRIPTEGEVGWELPDRYQPYWRGKITRISFELAGVESP
jgi:hypothetical protein